ncbi:TetR-like C-terminal domain-containing protein [Staphylococcus ureilyticus]|uniref:TetR-like C-terminal domain-containing protein n=1 Tax=Staphylococcus ureilyticus TaxID=94138 RepID=UPI0030C00A9C
MAENMERSAAQTNNLEEAGYAIARTYCQFAWENQTLYRIMYGLDGVPFGVSETWQEGMKIGEIAAEVLGDIYPDQSYEELYNNVEIFWGTMHGIIALTMADRISGGQKKAQILIRQAAAHLMNQ